MSSSGGAPYGVYPALPIGTMAGTAVVVAPNPLPGASGDIQILEYPEATIGQAILAARPAGTTDLTFFMATGPAPAIGISDTSDPLNPAVAEITLINGNMAIFASGAIQFLTDQGVGIQVASLGDTSIDSTLAISCDGVYQDSQWGPVIVDQTNGHTYRIVSTAGVLSTVMVT